MFCVTNKVSFYDIVWIGECMKYFISSVLMVTIVTAGIFIYRDNFAEAVLGGLLIALFMVFSMQFWYAQSLPKGRYRLFLLIGALLFVAGTFSSNIQFYKTTNYQKKSLIETRAIIGEGLLREKLTRIAVTLFDVYTKNGTAKTNRFDILAANFFRQSRFPSPFLIEPLLDGPPEKIQFIGGVYLTRATADSLVLTGIDTIGVGTKKEFKNILHQVGKVQAKIVLTSEGIRYQAEN